MRIEITAKIDNELAQAAGKHLPFAASLALNNAAVGSRDLVRSNLPSRFTLRNKWTHGGIQAKTGNKRNLTAHVLAPSYMRLQEEGGSRSPLESKMLAAPTDAIAGPRVISRAKRPGALIDAGKAFVLPFRSSGDAGVFQRYGKGKGKIRLLYVLSDRQEYDERFQFEEDVRSYVQSQFNEHFRDAVIKTMAGSKPR